MMINLQVLLNFAEWVIKIVALFTLFEKRFISAIETSSAVVPWEESYAKERREGGEMGSSACWNSATTRGWKLLSSETETFLLCFHYGHCATLNDKFSWNAWKVECFSARVCSIFFQGFCSLDSTLWIELLFLSSSHPCHSPPRSNLYLNSSRGNENSCRSVHIQGVLSSKRSIWSTRT